MNKSKTKPAKKSIRKLNIHGYEMRISNNNSKISILNKDKIDIEVFKVGALKTIQYLLDENFVNVDKVQVEIKSKF